MADDIRAAHAQRGDLEQRRETIHTLLDQPWDQASRYRRTIEDLNRVNAELIKDGTITVEEAAPIELVAGEVESAWFNADDPAEILAYSNAIPLPAAEQEVESA